MLSRAGAGERLAPAVLILEDRELDRVRVEVGGRVPVDGLSLGGVIFAQVLAADVFRAANADVLVSDAIKGEAPGVSGDGKAEAGDNAGDLHGNGCCRLWVFEVVGWFGCC